jgi:hypothetical protein
MGAIYVGNSLPVKSRVGLFLLDVQCEQTLAGGRVLKISARAGSRDLLLEGDDCRDFFTPKG